MAKDKDKDDSDDDSKKTASKKTLMKGCVKIIVISTMVLLIVGLLIMSHKNGTLKMPFKSTMTSKSKSVKTSRNSKHAHTNTKAPETGNESSSDDPKKFVLVDEIKKLETRQNRNLSQMQAASKDALNSTSSNMKEVKVLMKNNDKPGNRDVIAFLGINIDKFNNVNIKISFKTVSDEEIPSLVKRGVTKLPILAVGKKLYQKSSEIKKALTDMYIHSSKNGGAPGNPNSGGGDPDQQLREYMEQDLNMDAAEADDGDPEDGSDVMQRVIAMAAQRTKERQEDAAKRDPAKRKASEKSRKTQGAARSSSESAVERINRQSGKTGPVDRDDQLMMQKFLETGLDNDF